jgi:Ohr subfamily peroxiredoxin
MEEFMAKIEKVQYTANVHTTGGRDGGSSLSDDGRLAVHLSIPGPQTTGTNPEQLLAAGWSACFLSAIRLVAGKRKITLPTNAAVDAEVDLGTAKGEYFLQARLDVNLPGLEPTIAKALVDAAHLICPYSKATRGNIDVMVSVVA